MNESPHRALIRFFDSAREGMAPKHPVAARILSPDLSCLTNDLVNELRAEMARFATPSDQVVFISVAVHKKRAMLTDNFAFRRLIVEYTRQYFQMLGDSSREHPEWPVAAVNFANITKYLPWIRLTVRMALEHLVERDYLSINRPWDNLALIDGIHRSDPARIARRISPSNRRHVGRWLAAYDLEYYEQNPQLRALIPTERMRLVLEAFMG